MSQFKTKIDTLSRGKGRKPHKYIALLSMIQLLEEKGFNKTFPISCTNVAHHPKYLQLNYFSTKCHIGIEVGEAVLG